MKTTLLSALVTALLVVLPATTNAQPLRPLIRPGETLTYRVNSARFGDIGTAVMRVQADSVRGRAAWLLTFEFSAKIAVFKVSDRTRSWVDAETGNTLRYMKTERSPVGRRDEAVEILPDLRAWTSGRTTHGLETQEPLDELAYIYAVRALSGAIGDRVQLDRHFDPKRNPARMEIVGRELASTPAGTTSVTVIEMRVRDERQKDGAGLLRFHIGDDAARLPVRIDASMPVAGAIRMTLVSVQCPADTE